MNNANDLAAAVVIIFFFYTCRKRTQKQQQESVQYGYWKLHLKLNFIFNEFLSAFPL